MPFNTTQEVGGSIAIKDEGITIAAKAASVDLVGSGVSGTALGSAVTATIPGGGGTLSYETVNETPNGVITTFTFAHNIGIVYQNGMAQFTGAIIGNLTSIVTVTVVFKTAPSTGDQIINGYTG